MAAVALTGYFAFSKQSAEFGPYFQLKFLYIPIVLWAGFRFGKYGAVTTTFLMAVMAILGVLESIFELPIETRNQALRTSSFMAILAVTGTAVAAAVEQAQNAERSIRELNDQLEERVRARTEELRQKEHELVRTRRPELEDLQLLDEDAIQTVHPCADVTSRAFPA